MRFRAGWLSYGLASLIMLGWMLTLVEGAGASPLELKPLPAQRVGRLTKEARKQYELGLASVDKINYTEGLDHFKQAVEAEPANIFLRFTVVQLAQYLGQARTTSYIAGSPDPVKYYDLALDQLKEISKSPKLSDPERDRTKKSIETLTALRQSITERDEKRLQYGKEIAKQYASEIFKEKPVNDPADLTSTPGSASNKRTTLKLRNAREQAKLSELKKTSLSSGGNYSNRSSSSSTR